MEIEKCKVSIQFLLIFRQSGDVPFFLYARRLRGHTATKLINSEIMKTSISTVFELYMHFVVKQKSNFSAKIWNF